MTLILCPSSTESILYEREKEMSFTRRAAKSCCLVANCVSFCQVLRGRNLLAFVMEVLNFRLKNTVYDRIIAISVKVWNRIADWVISLKVYLI